MPTAAEAAAKACKTQGLCSLNTFEKMNVKDMKEHLTRESVAFLQNDHKVDLLRHHKLAVNSIPLQGVVDIIPTSNLEDLYEKQPDALGGVVTNLTFVLPTPRVVSPQQPAISESSAFLVEAFKVFHDITHAKKGMEAALQTAISDFGVPGYSNISCILDSCVEEDLLVVINCLSGFGKTQLQNVLRRLRLEIGGPDSTSCDVVPIIPRVISANQSSPVEAH
jgi:hypothetical protein